MVQHKCIASKSSIHPGLGNNSPSICFQLVDHRVEFTKWWVTEFKTIKFPSAGTVFDYFIDPESKKFEPWTKKVEKFELDPDIPLQAALVHTAETTRVKFFMDLLLDRKRPVMLVSSQYFHHQCFVS